MSASDRKLERMLREDLAGLLGRHRSAVMLCRPAEEIEAARAAYENAKKVVGYLCGGSSVRRRAELAGFDLAEWEASRRLRVNLEQATVANQMAEESERRRASSCD